MTKKTQLSVVPQDNFWAGTEASLDTHLMRLHHNVEREAAGTVISRGTNDEPKLPYLLEIQDGVATVSMHGPMSNTTSYWDTYDKAATYPAIREALIHAASDPQVSQILLDIDSGGGSVSGVADVAALVSLINDKVKPVTAFTDGAMMSAAYWIGSSAGEVYATKIAGAGSIGVIATHRDMSKFWEDMGVKNTVIRSGKYKALANSNEPLSEAGKKQIQDSLDVVYGVFVQHVADRRGVSYATTDQKMAQGREFWGEATVDAGLVDGIETFDSVMSKLKAKSVDNTKTIFHNPQQQIQGSNIMPKTALTEQQIAAMLSGAPAPQASAAAPAAAEDAERPNGDGATEAAAEQKPEGSEAQAAAEAAAAVAQVAAPAADSTILFLQAQIKDKDASILAANIEIAGLKGKVSEFESCEASLRDIVAKSVNNMRIALGGSALDMSAMTSTAILAEHQAFQTQFQDKFKVGGVAAVDAAEHGKKTTQAQVDPMEKVRLNSVRVTTKTKR